MKPRILATLVFATLLITTVFGLMGCSGQSASSVKSTDATPISEEVNRSQEASGVESGSETSSAWSSQEATAASAAADASTEDSYATEQDIAKRNSLAMLNYLRVIDHQVYKAKDNRLSLEALYDALFDNTHPNAVDRLTEGQILDMLDTLEGYRMNNVKKERLDYLNEQRQAQAMRDAVPNPVGLLSAVESGNMIALATSVAYMAVDSYSSYRSALSEASMKYLQDGWVLEDEAAAVLHDQRKEMFSYMMKMVRENNLDGDLVLSNASVDQLAEWSLNDNTTSRVQFLESNKDTYKTYGGYWLILAKSYYELAEQGQEDAYQKCIDAVNEYEKVQGKIFRYDKDYAGTIPLAISSAAIAMEGAAYIDYASDLVKKLEENATSGDWELLYFAALTDIDLYSRTGNRGYLESAFTIALNNVNNLVAEQRSLNEAYLNEVKEEPEPKGVTKERVEEVKRFNEMLKEERKTELPPVYEPLLINCDLLFALADEMSIDDGTREKIDRILHPADGKVFLTTAIDNKYRYTEGEDFRDIVDVEFDGTTLSIPASAVSALTRVVVTSGGETNTVPGEWFVKEVKRGKDGGVSDFKVVYVNKDAKGSYSDGDEVIVTLIDGEGDSAILRSYVFKVNLEERPLFIPDSIIFELVSVR